MAQARPGLLSEQVHGPVEEAACPVLNVAHTLERGSGDSVGTGQVDEVWSQEGILEEVACWLRLDVWVGEFPLDLTGRPTRAHSTEGLPIQPSTAILLPAPHTPHGKSALPCTQHPQEASPLPSQQSQDIRPSPLAHLLRVFPAPPLLWPCCPAPGPPHKPSCVLPDSFCCLLLLKILLLLAWALWALLRPSQRNCPKSYGPYTHTFTD